MFPTQTPMVFSSWFVSPRLNFVQNQIKWCLFWYQLNNVDGIKGNKHHLECLVMGNSSICEHNLCSKHRPYCTRSKNAQDWGILSQNYIEYCWFHTNWTHLMIETIKHHWDCFRIDRRKILAKNLFLHLRPIYIETTANLQEIE